LGVRSLCGRHSIRRPVKIRRHSRHRQHFHALGARAFESAREFVDGRSSRVDIVHDDDASFHFTAHLERRRQIANALVSREARLTRRVLASPDEMSRHWPAKPCRYQFGLIETTLTFARAVQRDRNHQISGKGLPVQTLSEKISQRPSQRYAVGILQMMNDLEKGLVKQKGGPGEIKDMLARHAQAA